MVLARWKTAAYTGSSEPRRLAEVVKQMEVSMSLATEEDFRPQKASTKRGSTTSGQTWEVDVGKKNGSRASTTLLGNKWPAILLRRMRRGIRLDLGGWFWRQ